MKRVHETMLTLDGRTAKALLAIEETALLLTLHTTGAEQAAHRAKVLAAYDERMELAFKAMAELAEESATTNVGG